MTSKERLSGDVQVCVGKRGEIGGREGNTIRARDQTEMRVLKFVLDQRLTRVPSMTGHGK